MPVVVIGSISLPLSETARALNPSTRPACRGLPPVLLVSVSCQISGNKVVAAQTQRREGIRHRGLRRVTVPGLVCVQLRLELWAAGWQVGGIQRTWAGYVSGSCL